jgi:branched-chain amino acid transport system ATP-binding protein
MRVADHLRLVSNGPTGTQPGLAFEAIERRMTSRAGMLSGGERQMLALTMAARQSPRLLLVDELSLGLAPMIVKDLMVSLRRLADTIGVPVILVEQDAAAALKIADRAYVMDRGQIVWQGDGDDTDAAEISTPVSSPPCLRRPGVGRPLMPSAAPSPLLHRLCQQRD